MTDWLFTMLVILVQACFMSDVKNVLKSFLLEFSLAAVHIFMVSAFILRLELKAMFDLVVVLHQRSIEERCTMFDLSFAHEFIGFKGALCSF